MRYWDVAIVRQTDDEALIVGSRSDAHTNVLRLEKTARRLVPLTRLAPPFLHQCPTRLRVLPLGHPGEQFMVLATTTSGSYLQ